MKKKILFFILLVICFCPGMRVSADEAAKYSIEIKELQNDRIQMDLRVSDFSEVYGAQIYLNFHKDVLEGAEVLAGDVIIEGDSNVRLISNRIDNASGMVTYMITKVGANETAVDEGILFSVIFNKKASGEYNFSVASNSLLSDREGNTVALELKEEVVNPEIVWVTPSENELNVGIDKAIKVYFDKEMKSDMQMFKDNIVVMEGTDVIEDLVFTLSDNKKELMISRNTDNNNIWESGKFYTVTIKTGIVDVDNMAVETEKTWKFVTEASHNEDIVLEITAPQGDLNINDTAKVSVRAANSAADKKVVTLILALYDENNNMIDYSIEEHHIEPGAISSLHAQLELTQKGTVKCIIWDNLEAMNPLTDAIKLNVAD